MVELGVMPTYYIAMSATPPPPARNVNIIQLLRRAIETAGCIAIEISTVGMVVECAEPAITVLEEAIRGELVAHGGSLNSISIQRL